VRKVLLIVLTLSFFVILPNVIVKAWWDFSWNSRADVTINNLQNPNTLTNYEIFVNVTYDSDMQTNFNDLRFLDSDDSTELPYWIENKMDSSYAEVWIKVPNIPASSTKDIMMYYGNPSASSASNAKNTFIVGDDFNDNSLDASLWTNNSYINENNGYAEVSSTDNTKFLGFCTKSKIARNVTMKVTMRPVTSTDWTAHYVYGSDVTDDWPGYTFLNNPSYYWTYYTEGDIRTSLIPNRNDLNAWVTSKFTVNQTGYFVWNNDILQKTDTSWSKDNQYFCFSVLGGSPATVSDYDNIIIYKDIHPEPTYSIGPEEAYGPINIAFVYPTILNSYISNNFVFINVTSDVNLTNTSLRWNGIMEPMLGSEKNWFLNKTNLSDGKYYFRVVGTDVNNNITSSNTSWVVIDTTSPVLTNPTPANNSYITGNSFQIFSIQVSDPNTKNGTLYYRRQNIDSDWQNVPLASCSGSSPTCSATIDASGVEEGNTVSYYFEVYDQTNHVGHYGTVTDYLMATVDRTPPSWSDIISYPISGVAYAPNQSYQFNIIVTDNFAVDTVLLEVNNGIDSRTYVSTKDGNVYYTTLTDLPANSTGYSLQWYMNDTAGNENYADIWSYVINKAPSQVRLLLDGTENNITITTGEIVDITGELIAGQGDIYLYENDLLIDSEPSPLTYLNSTFDVPGTYNITLVYYETENYTGVSTGISVVINETGSSTSPSISSVSLPSTHMTTFNTLTNNANPVETRFIIVQSDSDNDGVPDSQDKCPNTVLPESIPKLSLLPWHYADVDGDRTFETAKLIKGKCVGDNIDDFKKCKLGIVDSEYTLTDTHGCSCEQILKLKPGNNIGEKMFGCSRGTIEVFTKQMGWAKNLF
jgi:hypothetical protein